MLQKLCLILTTFTEVISDPCAESSSSFTESPLPPSRYTSSHVSKRLTKGSRHGSSSFRADFALEDALAVLEILGPQKICSTALSPVRCRGGNSHSHRPSGNRLPTASNCLLQRGAALLRPGLHVEIATGTALTRHVRRTPAGHERELQSLSFHAPNLSSNCGVALPEAVEEEPATVDASASSSLPGILACGSEWVRRSAVGSLGSRGWAYWASPQELRFGLLTKNKLRPCEDPSVAPEKSQRSPCFRGRSAGRCSSPAPGSETAS